jgi:ABC-type sugar transport system substrate-binding protein
MKKLCVIGMMVVALTGLFAGGEKEAGEINVTLVQKNLTNPMWIAVSQGATAAAEKLGVTLTILAPMQADNNEEQINIIEQSIAKKMDCIIVIPADGAGIVPAIEKANEAGIPIINVNTKIDTSKGCKVETFISVENYTAAVSVAEELVKMLNKKGRIIILEGKAGASSSVDIVKGANDTFAKYSGIRVIDSQTASWNRAEALKVTQNLLQAHPDVNAIFAANDEMAMGAVEAISQVGKSDRILVTGLDANEDARKAVDEGRLAITCDKNGYGQGYEGVAAAVKAIRGEKLDNSIVISTKLYTKK